MEKLDLDLQRQVWQRVSGKPQEPAGDIRCLMLDGAESVAVYRQLVAMLTGRQREQAKRLLGMAQRSLNSLKGIQSLSGHPAGALRQPPVPKEPARRLLETSYHRALRRRMEYTARSLDPEFGVVWQALADREGEAALLLTELIGGTDK